jgi:hypothetical protein
MGHLGNGLPAWCSLSVDFWDEFRYWEAVFSSPVVPFGGVTRSFSRFQSLPLQQLAFDRHVYTDASTSFGWGAVLSGHVIFGPWRDLSAMGLKFGRYLFQAPTILLSISRGLSTHVSFQDWTSVRLFLFSVSSLVLLSQPCSATSGRARRVFSVGSSSLVCHWSIPGCLGGCVVVSSPVHICHYCAACATFCCLVSFLFY